MTTVRVARYARISEDPTGLQVGVERQLVDIDVYVARHPNWVVVDTFTDDDKPAYRKPGEAAKLRPEYARLLKCARAREFDVVVGYHTSRWHRDIMEYLTFTELLKATGIGWHTSAEGEIRFENATDAATSLTRAVWNQHESALKSERVTRAKLDHAIAGKFNGGARPYGYLIDPDKDNRNKVSGGLLVCDSEAAIVREVADKFLRGVSLRSMAFDLNERGITKANGARWSASHLSQTLSNSVLAGIRKHGSKEYPAMWEPILDCGKWEAIQAIRSDPSRRTKDITKGPVPRRLGTGIYICGVCKKRSLRSGGGNSKNGSYMCVEGSDHVTRRIDKLDAYIEGAVVGKLSEPGVIEAAVSRASAGDDVELAAMRSEFRENEIAQGKLAETLVRPGIATAVLLSTTAAIDRLADRANQIRRELARAGENSPLSALLDIDDIEAAWSAMTLGEQRAILNATVDVTVFRARKGRGPGGVYFDPAFIDLDFKI